MATDSERRCTAWGHYNMHSSQCRLPEGHDGYHDGGSYIGRFAECEATYRRPGHPLTVTTLQDPATLSKGNDDG